MLHRRYPEVERERERERQPPTQFSVGTETKGFIQPLTRSFHQGHKAVIPNPWAMDWYQSRGLLGTGSHSRR